MAFNERDITSGEQYADLLIEEIKYLRSIDEDTNPLEDELIEKWYRYIKKACIKKYREYSKGREENFKLSDGEMEDLYQQAFNDLVNEALETLVDRGDVSLSIGEDGEILYSATEQGLDRLKNDDGEES